MTTTQDLQLKWAQHSDAIGKANDLNKRIVFEALSAAGIDQVAVDFDGEGDSGQIDNVAARAGDKLVEFPDTAVKLHRAQYGHDKLTTHEISLRGAVEQLCYGYLQQEHGGWENNDGAFGEFTFDVAQRRIALDFNGRFTDYAHSTHTW